MAVTERDHPPDAVCRVLASNTAATYSRKLQQRSLSVPAVQHERRRSRKHNGAMKRTHHDAFDRATEDYSTKRLRSHTPDHEPNQDLVQSIQTTEIALPETLQDYHFEDDSESIYAAGLARVVRVQQEGQSVPAILLSFELSQQLQIAVQAMRLVFQSQDRSDTQLAQLKDLEQKLQTWHDQVRTPQDCYARIAGWDARREQLMHEHVNLELRKQHMQRDKKLIERRHYDLSQRTFAAHGRIAHGIARALADSGLLQPTTDFPQATHWDRSLDRRCRALDDWPELHSEVEAAEKEFAERQAARDAKIDAIAKGLDLVSDTQSSMFGDDGVVPDWQQGPVLVRMDRRPVERWLDGVEDGLDDRWIDSSGKRSILGRRRVWR